MAEVEEAVFSLLTGDGDVAAMAETRIYPQEIPQDVELPAIAYARISTRRVKSHTGPSGLARARVQVNCEAASYRESKALAAAARRVLDGVMTTVTGLWVQGAWIENEGDEYGETDKLYGVRQDFMIWYSEAA